MSATLSAGEWKRLLRAEDKELCAEMRVKTGRGLAVGSERFEKNSCKKTAKVGRMFSTGESEKERQNNGRCSILLNPFTLMIQYMQGNQPNQR